MRLVFMGTPAFAATCLRRIAAEQGVEIIGVYTKPDVPRNRGMKLAHSEVKQLALELELPVFQPANFREDETVCALRALRPDLIAVVAYGKILPQSVLDIPPLGCINIHGSLLPKLRGAAPVQWAILNGFTETGVTAQYLSAGVDEGDIIDTIKTPIDPAESAGALMDRLAILGADLLCSTIRKISDGSVTRTPQDHAAATYAPMLTKELSPICWGAGGREILCRIHGLDPWPAATAEFDGVPFKIYDAEIVDAPQTGMPGTPVALDKRGLTVLCGDGAVRITELQAPGGKRMRAPDYFRGHPIQLP